MASEGKSFCSFNEQNSAFCSGDKLQIRDESGVFRCTKDANSMILETGRFHNDDVARKILEIGPLGLKLDVSALLSILMENNMRHSPPQTCEKLKAANFEATLIKIGRWERKKKNEGDMVAKCYFAKKKLVWEFLEGHLKRKIEIQWNEIIGIRAILEEHKPGVLEIELNKVPDFYVEIDPQPRKHTIWKPASDFTEGEASNFRRHYIVFPPGLLDKNYEKLLQCDPRLYELSLKPFPTLRSPHFEQRYNRFLNFSTSYQPGGSITNGEFHFNFSIPSRRMETRPHLPFNQASPISVMDFPPLVEHIPSLDNVFDHTTMMGQAARGLANGPLPSAPHLPGLLSYENHCQFSGPGNLDSNMMDSALMHLEENLFSEDQVKVYDERYHMQRVASLLAIVQSEGESSRFGQENGSVFEEQTFHGQGFTGGRNDGGLIESENNYQPNEFGGQVGSYSPPINSQEPLIQAWHNLTDPRDDNVGPKFDFKQKSIVGEEMGISCRELVKND